jgi:hypothetical protein
MANHPLDEVLCHAQALQGPGPQPAEVAPAERQRQAHPRQQQHDMQGAARSRQQDARGEQQFQQGDEDAEAAIERQRFERLRFQHPSQQFAGALPPHRFDIAAQRTGQQARLQDTPGVQREARIQPPAEQLQRHQRQHHQHPGGEPAALDAAVQRALPDQGPGEDFESVQQGEGRGDRHHAAAQPALRQVLPQAAPRRQPQHPAARERQLAQAVAQQRRAHRRVALRVALRPSPAGNRSPRRTPPPPLRTACCAADSVHSDAGRGPARAAAPSRLAPPPAAGILHPPRPARAARPAQRLAASHPAPTRPHRPLPLPGRCAAPPTRASAPARARHREPAAPALRPPLRR